MYSKTIVANTSNRHIAENAGGYLKSAKSALDLVRANQLWQGMESILSDAISRAKQTAIGKVCPASFGFTGIQSQSGSLVNPVRIISEAMDVVILPDESHRELI